MKDDKFCILAIDDEAIILEQIEDIFEDDYVVFTTDDPGEALDLILKENIDLVICDQKMPKLLGTKLLVGIKSKNEDVARILLTGYSDLQTAIEAINQGAIHRYEQKPIDVEKLQNVVKEELDKYELRMARKDHAAAYYK